MSALLRVCTALLFLLCAPAWADGVQKLGYIDTERVYRETRQAQMISERLAEEFAVRRQELEAANRHGFTLERVISEEKNADRRRAREKELAQLRRQYLLAEQKFAEDFSLRRNEEFAGLQQRANQIIADLAKKEGYDLILQDVVYVNARFDITDKVIKALNGE